MPAVAPPLATAGRGALPNKHRAAAAATAHRAASTATGEVSAAEKEVVKAAEQKEAEIAAAWKKDRAASVHAVTQSIGGQVGLCKKLVAAGQALFRRRDAVAPVGGVVQAAAATAGEQPDDTLSIDVSPEKSPRPVSSPVGPKGTNKVHPVSCESEAVPRELITKASISPQNEDLKQS